MSNKTKAVKTAQTEAPTTEAQGITLKSVITLPLEAIEALHLAGQISEEVVQSYKDAMAKKEAGAKLKSIQDEFVDGLGKWKPLHDRLQAVSSKLVDKFGADATERVVCTISITPKGWEFKKSFGGYGKTKGAGKGGSYNITCNGETYTSWSKLCAAHDIEVGKGSANRIAFKHFEGNFPLDEKGKLIQGQKDIEYVLTPKA